MMSLLDHLRDSAWCQWQDTGHFLSPRTDDDRRRWVVDVALRLVGFGGADREGEPSGRAQAMADLVGTGETHPEALLDTSTCGLVVRGLWRLLGVRHPALEAPYRTGFAVADIVTIGRQAGASERWPRNPALIVPGTVLRIGGTRGEGESGDYGGPTHVLVVVEVDGAAVTSVDGGQRESPIRGRWQTQHVARRTRELVQRDGGLWLSGARHDGGRMVREVIDCARLPYAVGESVLVPMRADPAG